jgi:hypothetical protein
MPFKDYYALLGVSPDETPSGIRAAYREAVRRTHPDHAGAESAPHFQDIVEAHSVLSDPERRKRYDESLERALHLEHRSPTPVAPRRNPHVEIPHGLAIDVMLTPEEAAVGVVHVAVPVRGRIAPLLVHIPLSLRMGILRTAVLAPFQVEGLIVRIRLEVSDEEF